MSVEGEHDTYEDPEAALREVRSRFIADFSGRMRAFRSLLERLQGDCDTRELPSLQHTAHKLTGLAGMVGFASVSARAQHLETLASNRDVSADHVRAAIDALEAAFVADISAPAPSWSVAPQLATRARVLTIEDDDDQRRVLVTLLTAAGCDVAQHASGLGAIDVVRRAAPELVLLDLDLPEENGYDILRRLKADASLSSIPVIFLTSRSAPVDRVAGLGLGADDFINKPFEPSELLLRVNRLLRRGREEAARQFAPSAGTPAPASRAQHLVVIAEDDPDVLHIVEPRLKAAGLATVLAFDGREALAAVLRHRPRVLLLDLMMPKMTGFELLAKLRHQNGQRPRVLVVSARGREEDVTRAFDLGADDYLTKPFSPAELIARVERLLP